MSPAKAEVLVSVRRHLREWGRQIAVFEEGQMRLYTNNVDTSERHLADLRRLIADNELLLQRYDPDGLTDDGAIELGRLPRGQGMSLLPGKYVTYRLDHDGKAVDLALFDDEATARAYAQGREVGVGVVNDDNWSISPLE